MGSNIVQKKRSSKRMTSKTRNNTFYHKQSAEMLEDFEERPDLGDAFLTVLDQIVSPEQARALLNSTSRVSSQAQDHVPHGVIRGPGVTLCSRIDTSMDDHLRRQLQDCVDSNRPMCIRGEIRHVVKWYRVSAGYCFECPSALDGKCAMK
jgi:hypothetical protein